MKIEDTLKPQRNAEKNDDLTEALLTLDEACKKCKPATPLECVSRCKIWKLKNELRRLHETMENPNFIRDLLNVLKNNTRVQILQVIARSHYSVSKLQQELKKTGRIHSQDTLAEEYLRPLLEVGLVAETQDQYYATAFGGKLTELLDFCPEFVDFLPAHSECYEETIVKALLEGPKTFEELQNLISPKIVSRILKRLKTTGLIETPLERDYIFFFRSKRDPNKEVLFTTENRVYTNIPDEGISAKKLAEKTSISMRRTYKYLRGLKGKKLVFTRKTPKTYALTANGHRLALLVYELHNLVEETLISSERFVKNNENS